MIDPESWLGVANKPMTTAGPPPTGVVVPPVTPTTLPTVNTRHPLNRPPLTRGQDVYGGFTAEQLAANPALVARLGGHAAARWAARPATTPAAPPPVTPTVPTPTMGQPVGSMPVTPAGPNAPINGGNGDFGPPAGWYGGQGGGANDFTDPMQMFMSAVPAMRMNTQKQIGDAMAAAGGTGNRWGSSAQRTAGQIGAESGMQENALLQQMLSTYANNQDNRALQASQQGMQLGNLQDNLAQSRLQMPFNIGQYEQGRADNFANTQFQDWSQNRLGWLGPFLQAANAQGAGSPGSPGPVYSTSTPSTPGTSDYLRIIASLFG